MDKERIKEFLKPDWRKVLLLVLLFGFSVVFGVTNIGGELLLVELNPFLWAPYALFGFCCPGWFIPSGEYLFHPVWLLPGFVYWYLLSCLMVSIYDKLRKRKQ
ncbi:hypothetical protein KY347_05600 [Candidatus Woesearchaeota archaeon]|nr:hypothetical protein [Candidatus Woesearchaeota archaeon]